MDAVIQVGGLIAIAYFLSGYRKESTLAPSESLPIRDVDVRRWRHNGQQPLTDQTTMGNNFHTAPWPEVETLLS
jgi:hypothetical protein